MITAMYKSRVMGNYCKPLKAPSGKPQQRVAAGSSTVQRAPWGDGDCPLWCEP